MNRLNLLASDLGETVSPALTLRPGDAGDAGADVVGWFPFADGNRSLMAFLAQATCLVDWKDHQHHASYPNWRQLMTLKTPTTNILLTPQCFRKADGGWAFDQDIIDSVLIDRVRLNAILTSRVPPRGALAEKTIETALQYREDIV
jgi:hypothetical protein